MGRQLSADLSKGTFVGCSALRQDIDSVDNQVRFVEELVSRPSIPVMKELEDCRNAVVASPHKKLLGIDKERDGEKRGGGILVRGGESNWKP